MHFFHPSHAIEFIVLLQNFNAMPDSDSLLNAKLIVFLVNKPENYSLINNQTFQELVEEVVISNATPALWFYAAGGTVLITLALMGLLDRWPRGMCIAHMHKY